MASRHFFKVMMPGFTQNLSIPVTFVHGELHEENGKTAVLRSRNGKTWRVEVSRTNNETWRFNGSGWDDFLKQHDLDIGDFLVFEHEENLVFNVFVFDPSYCEKDQPSQPTFPQSHYHHYQHDDRVTLNRHHHDKKGSSTKRDQREPIHKAVAAMASGSTSSTLCARARFASIISPTNLIPSHPYLNVPRKFVKGNGLQNIAGTITIKDQEGRSWQMKLGRRTNLGVYQRTFIGAGWYEFAIANKLKPGDVCIMELDKTSSRINEGLIILNAQIQ